MAQGKILLNVKGVSIAFTQYERGFRQASLPVIQDLSLRVREGEVVAVVGSSGSGKSLLAHGILGILPYNARMEGELSYQGEALTPLRQKQLRGREIVLVPQSVSYLNPLMKIGPQVRRGRRDRGIWERGRAALSRYGLGPEVERQYPFELSGGMARRVLISTAVLEQPRLVIADEPTPGLHISAAKRVLGHFRELADQGAGVLLITHDLELALEVADRIVVLYAGSTVEEARAEDFGGENTLRHPYTRALWRAMPQNGFEWIAGSQPYAGDLPAGCAFAPRCHMVSERCGEHIPYRQARGGYVRCVRGGEGEE